MDGVERLQNPLEYEERFWSRGISTVAGVDEVGRGPLAGPVVAAAVVLPEGCCIHGADDSKRLTSKRREALASEVLAKSRFVSLGAASVREIDRLNILVCTRLAMTRALSRLPSPPGHIVIDGLPVRGLPWDHDAVVGGDGKVHSISCASIVAKVVRDRLMVSLDARYPGYEWSSNKGYGSAKHREALERLGPTPHHRLTFGGVQTELEF